MKIKLTLAMPYQEDSDYVNSIYSDLKSFGVDQVDVTYLDYGVLEVEMSWSDANRLMKINAQIKRMDAAVDSGMITERKIVQI